jgi:hypothetical protein
MKHLLNEQEDMDGKKDFDCNEPMLFFSMGI